MPAQSQYDRLLIGRVRQAEPQAWEELIARYEGRLLAFVESRVGNRASAEDVVQETFIGFLNSLPNYDLDRPLESYLFSIAAHKLTDLLRREGRRPTVPLVPSSGSQASSWDMPGQDRPASSIVRSGERKAKEEDVLAEALAQQIGHWRERGDWQKIQIAELLFVRGWANKDVAAEISISEQAVANCKFDFLAKLRAAVRKHGFADGELIPGQ
ncbi:MAG: sigma-70 family RNA polymerase sigma factor [Planctomycetia bacterium]|nr:sigma-70 family RNA polymerase sigma factor [Planctomycetia bacterium]